MSVPIAIECVSALSCLGDYAAMATRLVHATPDTVFTRTPNGVYGMLDDEYLAASLESAPRYTRSERIVLALINQQKDRIARCLEGVKPERIAVIVGTTAGGIAEAESSRRPGHQFTTDYDIRFQRLGQIARFTAEQLGARGLTTGTSTACTSGARAIGLGMRWLDLNWCDVAVVGGVDARCALTLQGFTALEAVSQTSCRPFDTARDGITLGEAGALLVLVRDKERNEARVGLCGYADSMDAWHLSAPHPEGAGITRAMSDALAMSAAGVDDVGYVNLHGTGTVLNDAMEARAVRDLLGSNVPVSSTKAMTGHTLGAAGALEAVICHALLNGDLEYLPIQHGMDQLDPALPPIDVVIHMGRSLTRPLVLSNSCGFGGHNAALVLGRMDD